ncbi:glycoside hydrolase family 5 protein [Clostridium ganghwense]|uniref:Glycoside hydrolase family 5 protein n=1 Tax=Clostridium ganghwense TaxID=312089 RepID=A0ABT4CU71_9CLOT|nr:glycoside hydrolase family 5 protein [Clostridium ganghwense]MCY6372615.1 glycoside hydrolase family 5 protein [Clostridium ganghwense]
MEKRKQQLMKVIILLLIGSTSYFMFNNYCFKNKNSLPFYKCMNIGNALDAPKNISWDVEIKKEYFDLIKEAGFDSVRIPVRFSDYAKNQPNYVLEEEFMKEIDGYIDYALSKDLVVILDLHHFVEIMEEPTRYRDCFFRIWEQLSQRYQKYPDKLIFELLNEPTKNLKPDIWNEYLNEAIKIIRQTNKDRLIIIGSAEFSSLYSLKYLTLPKDKNIMVTFHFYEPNEFTFQGNIYHPGFEHLKNIPWRGTNSEVQYIKERFSIVKKWSDENNIRVFLGEFGVNKNAPEEDRVLWSKQIRKAAEEMDFAWGYWEFCSEFGVYNSKTFSWNKLLLNALVDEE